MTAKLTFFVVPPGAVSALVGTPSVRNGTAHVGFKGVREVDYTSGNAMTFSVNAVGFMQDERYSIMLSRYS